MGVGSDFATSHWGRLAAIADVVFYVDTSRLFFREVTTVSRVLRKLAARWGVVQPVGHLTVNEDGEGSNPSAPANFPRECRCLLIRSIVRRANERPRTWLGVGWY